MNSTANKFIDNQSKIKDDKHRHNIKTSYTPHKEAGGYEAPTWEEYHHEFELQEKVKELGGIEKIGEGKVEVPAQVAREMGVEHKISPTQQALSQVTDLPLSDTKIVSARQAAPITDSVRWLAEFCWLQLQKLHLSLKEIGGRVVRIRTK